MSEALKQSAQEIVTEISMSTESKPWLIVEGPSDGVFFSTRDLFGNPEIVVAYGWENVIEVINTISSENIRAAALGIIDRDYLEDLGKAIAHKNVILSDFRDIEITLFESSALCRILAEYGSPHKLPRKPNKELDIQKVRKELYSTATIFGKLRFYSQKNQLAFSIKKIDFSKAIKPDLKVEKKAIIDQINSKSAAKINEEIYCLAIESELPERLSDQRNLCSGHDIMKLLGIALKKLWGSNNTNEVSIEKLECAFRIGFSNQEFQATKMYKELDLLLNSLAMRNLD